MVSQYGDAVRQILPICDGKKLYDPRLVDLVTSMKANGNSFSTISKVLKEMHQLEQYRRQLGYTATMKSRASNGKIDSKEYQVGGKHHKPFPMENISPGLSERIVKRIWLNDRKRLDNLFRNFIASLQGKVLRIDHTYVSRVELS